MVIVTEHEFLLTGAESAVPGIDSWDEAVRTAIRPRFSVAAGSHRVVSRVWLDTFDWRLRAAGLALAYTTGPDDTCELTLIGPGGCTQRLHDALSWPRLIEGLPPGPLTGQLRPVVGIRALLPVAGVDSIVDELRILNRDEKTVVRAYLDRPSGPLPARLSLAAVRGHTRQVERAAKLLAGIPGVVPCDRSELDTLLAAADRDPGADTAVRLDPGQDAADAVARLLLGLLDVIESNVPGTVEDWDTEFLHDLRVAVRRTRSALKLAGDALPGGIADRFAPEFKWLGDLTTPMRDLDTLLLGFGALTGELTDADPGDLRPLRAYLERHRVGELETLVAGLRSDRFVETTGAWRTALTAAVPAGRTRRRRRPAPRTAPATTARALAGDRLRRAWRRVARLGPAISTDSPPEVLHNLRKRCKELRYVLELFGPLYDADLQRPLVKDLKVLQDCLGEFQDAEVHRDAVRTYAAAMMDEGSATAPAMLAMGELAARLGRRQRRAARTSVENFRRFATDRNERRVTAVTET